MARRKKVKLKKFGYLFLFIILIGIVISPYFIFNIKLIGDKEVIVNYGDKYSESGYLLNVFGNNLTDSVKVKDNINDEIGKYQVIYSYKFLFYKISTIRDVIVKDIKGPKIELIGGDSVDVIIMYGTISIGFILLFRILRLIIVVGIMVMAAVFVIRKVIILRDAVSLFWFKFCSSFIAFSPNGVAAFPTPSIFIIIFIDI